MNVTVLADNTVAKPFPRGLRGEWGFAAAVGGVLFDTGQSSVAAHNARLLGVDPDFEAVVLSHAHFDHTAGLDRFLDPVDRPTLYCHPDLWTDRFSLSSPGGEAFPEPVHVGVPYSRAAVASGAEIVEHRDPVAVAEDVVALGEIPREYDDTATGKRVGGDHDEDAVADGDDPADGAVPDADDLVDDAVRDDQALAVDTGEGGALVLGCCHAGVRNTVEYAESVLGEPVRYLIGGTHLVAREPEAVHRIADWLAGRIDLFAGTHCTGPEAEAILAERLPEAVRSVGVGSEITLPPGD